MQVDDELVARLRTALFRTTRLIQRRDPASTDPEVDLTRTQLSVLASAARLGPLGLSELAQVEDVNPTMLSRIVAKLDDAGLIERTADPQDRRAARVQVTPAGHALHLRLRAARTLRLSERLAELTPTHRETLLAALPALEELAGPAQEITAGPAHEITVETTP